MIKHLVGIIVFLFVLSSFHSVLADEPILIRHYQKQDRYKFGIKLLNLAMSKLGQDYKIVCPEEHIVNEVRGEKYIIDGKLDIEFMSTNVKREACMLPVKIPVYRGLLGLRLLLIIPSNNKSCSTIRNIEGLRQFVGGHGKHWGDLPVYTANNLRVKTSYDYQSLFKMLIRQRFDYFHRGVCEIWEELDRYSNDLIIADSIMLFYEHPVYFFIGKHRPDLALQVEKGLNISLQDGSYKKLFMEYHGDVIKKGNLNQRILIPLKNPAVPLNTPPTDTSWWMPGNKLNEIRLTDFREE